MLYRKTKFLVGMTLIAALLMVTRTALAPPTDVDVSGVQFTLGVCDPGITWTDDEGITHTRGLILEVLFVGDIEGIAFQTLDVNIDPFGNGDLHGSVEFTGTLFDVAAELTGHFAGDLIAGEFFAESIGHGTVGGAQAQSRLLTIGILGGGESIYTGTFHFPHGQ